MRRLKEQNLKGIKVIGVTYLHVEAEKEEPEKAEKVEKLENPEDVKHI
jgi:hypothetical protein